MAAEVVTEVVISVVTEREVEPVGCVVILLGRVNPAGEQAAVDAHTEAISTQKRHREMIFFNMILTPFIYLVFHLKSSAIIKTNPETSLNTLLNILSSFLQTSVCIFFLRIIYYKRVDILCPVLL